MFTSGAFRLQCLLQASNQDEYAALRFGRLDTPNGATNISILDTVERVEADELANNSNIKTYLELNRTLNDQIRDRHLSVAEWFADKPDLTMEPLGSDELPVKLALESQQDGLVLAASHLSVVVSIRGTELGEVPIYGPKSISDAKEMKFSEVRLPRELLQ